MSNLKVEANGLNRAVHEMKRALDIVARLLSNKGVRVIFKGTRCYTDHKIICLPELSLLERKGMTPAEVKEAQHFLEAVRGYLFHEVAHILYTDQKVWNEACLKHGKFFHSVLNLVEDPRIEQKMTKLWRGSGAAVMHTVGWVLPGLKAKMKGGSLVGRFLTAFCYVTRLGTDSPFFKQLDADVKVLFGRFLPELRRARALDSTADSVQLALDLIEKLKLAAPPPKKKEEEKPKKQKPVFTAGEGDEGEAEESEESEGEGDEDDGEAGGAEPEDEEADEDEEGDAESEAEAEEDEGDEGEEEDEAEAEEDEEPGDEEDADEAAAKAKAEMDDTAAIEEEIAKADAATLLGQYLEPNVATAGDKYLIFTTEFDDYSVPPSCPPTEYAALIAKARGAFGIVKRNLSNALRSRADTLSVHELEEGDLDTGALYRLASGVSNKVFMESHEQLDTSVAVAILVNESGSMGDTAGKFTRIELAKVTCALLGEVLDSLAIPFAIYGHTTGSDCSRAYCQAQPTDLQVYARWGPTVVRPYKSFDESFHSAKLRLPGLCPHYNTHDGEALLHAGTALMAVKGVQRRILITIDDGEPYPCIAPNVYNMQGRHIAYLHEVVKSLTAAKVEVLGMGMGTSSVTRYYPASVVVNDMATFPTVALTEMKKLLTKKS